MLSQITRWFRSSAGGKDGVQAHMTFGKTSIGRSISRTGVFSRSTLDLAGHRDRLAVGDRLDRQFGDRADNQGEPPLGIANALNVERSMLETWLRVQEANAEALATTNRFAPSRSKSCRDRSHGDGRRNDSRRTRVVAYKDGRTEPAAGHGARPRHDIPSLRQLLCGG